MAPPCHQGWPSQNGHPGYVVGRDFLLWTGGGWTGGAGWCCQRAKHSGVSDQVGRVAMRNVGPRAEQTGGDVAGGGTEPVGGWQGQGVHHSQGAQARHGVSCRRWIKVFHLVSMWTWPHCSVGSDHLILLHTELIRFVSCTALVSEKSITLFSDTLTGLMCWKKKANTGFSLLYICSCCKAVLAVWELLRRGNIQRGRWPACCIGHLCARKAVCSCTRSCTWKLRICP